MEHTMYARLRRAHISNFWHPEPNLTTYMKVFRTYMVVERINGPHNARLF